MSTPTSPLLPQSNALAEASQIDSLAEVMSRDPEGLSRQDRNRIVEALREQRRRIEAATAQGIKPRTRSASSGTKVPLSRDASQNAEDLGL